MSSLFLLHFVEKSPTPDLEAPRSPPSNPLLLSPLPFSCRPQAGPAPRVVQARVPDGTMWTCQQFEPELLLTVSQTQTQTQTETPCLQLVEYQDYNMP